jgi:hypothetical protein
VPAVTTNLFATSPHLLFSTSQNNPVDASQSLVPHVQLPELIEEPSVTEHMVLVLQVLSEAKQNKPLEEVQSLVPHAQLSELTAEPSSTEHDAYWRQVLVDDVQNKPVVEEQTAVPHSQASALAWFPSVSKHALTKHTWKPLIGGNPKSVVSHVITSLTFTTTLAGPLVPA